MPFTRCSWIFWYSTQQLLCKCKMMQNVCKNRAEDLPWLSQGMQSTGTLCWKFFFSMKFYLPSPPAWYVSSTVPSGASKTGSSSTTSLKKKIALGTHTHKNPIPWWINEGSPRTDIICMLSFFNAVAGENNSMPACYPEICCAKANSWQQVASREGTKVFDGWVFLPKAERSICEKLVIYCGWNGPFTG